MSWQDFPPSSHFPDCFPGSRHTDHFISSNVPTLFTSYSGLLNLLFDPVPITVFPKSLCGGGLLLKSTIPHQPI